MAKLDKLSKDDLAKERAEAESRLKEIAKAQAEYDGRRLKELRAEIEGMLSKEGFSLDDLTQGRTAKKSGASKSKAPAKYRHPENAELTWSGRGRQPAWYKDAVAAGTSPEDMAV